MRLAQLPLPQLRRLREVMKTTVFETERLRRHNALLLEEVTKIIEEKEKQ